MRPVKLVMSAFGPYAGQTEVDFESLGASGVYLVCGDTGSGKTMIFDAICFALFGEASGDAKGGARSTSSLRSDYAQGPTPTFVELVFEYRGKRYRVRRNPDYTRAKTRGEGQTKQTAGAELEFPDGRVVSGVRKVNAAVEELLGIDAEQFKQIVMLAQGEFRKLLTADTVTREGIFRKLFGTEVHERFQERLAEESRELERRNLQVKTQIAAVASQAALPAGSELAAAFEERRGGAQMGPWLLEALEGLLAQDEPEHVRLDAEVDALRMKWSEASALLKQAELRPVEQAEVERLRAEAARLESEAPGLAAELDVQKERDREREAALARAAQVEGTFGKYGELRDAEQAATVAHEREDAAARALSQAEETCSKIAREVERLGTDAVALDGAGLRLVRVESDLADVKREVDAAQKALDDARALEEKEKAAAAAREDFAGMQAAYAHAQETARARAVAAAEAQAELAAYDGAEVAQAERKAALVQAKQRYAQVEGLVERRLELAGDATRAERPYRHAQEELVAKERIHDKDEAALQDLQRRQRAGRAGLLALELEAGAPCPVCGSVHHPAPAHAQAAIPTDDEIDAASAREARSKEEANACSVDAGRLQAVYREKARLLEAFDAEQGGEAGLSATLAAARTALADAGTAYDDAVAQVGKAADARAAAVSAEKRSREAAALLEQADAACRKAREAQVAAEHAARAMREGLGAVDVAVALARRDAAAERLTRAHAVVDAAKRDAGELARIQQALDAAHEAAREADGRRDAARTEAAQCASGRAIADERVANLRADLEFADLDAARAEVDSLRERASELAAAREAAARAVRENASAIMTTAELQKAAARRLRDIPDVDAEVVRERMDELQRQGNEVKAQATVLKTRIDANAACRDRLRAALAKAGDIEERYGRVKMLADVATGNLVGKAKVRFEAYVQAIYFDKVIAAANERLKLLTSGQFELIRYSEGAGNAKAGLGLYVIDSFTGRARDASSLSGGESFQASLCLALGLSDIVQAHAGGIEFDTMFVDEGFGSLDAGALGNAISLLSDLSGGTKLVGIISHVEDLKANIPKKIVVTKGRTGSSVSVEL